MYAAVAADLPAASPLLSCSFVALALLVTAAIVGGVRWSALRSGLSAAAVARQTMLAAAVGTAWLTLAGVAAGAGALRFDSPPTMLAVFPLVLVLSVGAAFSPIGTRLA